MLENELITIIKGVENNILHKPPRFIEGEKKVLKIFFKNIIIPMKFTIYWI